ncbi:hypothetical protein C8R45DRAFT_1030240 [Mycena sanguinolenta]|nr:hypothetical protein C8R45DRAFT_1030240 [Mycena sanguinolenta]
MFHAWIVHNEPPHFSKAEFEAKLEALVDQAVLLPIVQKNLVKFEMAFQKDVVDEHAGSFGFPPRNPVVFCILQSETPEQVFEVLAAPEVRKVFDMGKEWGLHDFSSGFAATVVPKIDNPAPKDGKHLICVYNVPPSLSSAQHDNKWVEFMDEFIEVVARRNHFVRFDMWSSNNLLDEHMRAFGYSAAGPTFINHGICDGEEAMFEVMQDPAAHKSVMDAGNDGEHFDLKVNAYVFNAHVVTKIDKTC